MPKATFNTDERTVELINLMLEMDIKKDIPRPSKSKIFNRAIEFYFKHGGYDKENQK